MSVKKWVMSDELWVTIDEWRKLSDEKTLPKQALSAGRKKFLEGTYKTSPYSFVSFIFSAWQEGYYSVLLITIVTFKENVTIGQINATKNVLVATF